METTPNERAWKQSLLLGQTHCCYCRRRFTDDLPPTIDHIVTRPEAPDGADRSDGRVLACQPCNSMRGATPYEEYVAAVDAEWAAATAEGRAYRRPRRIDIPYFHRGKHGPFILTTMTRAERRAWVAAGRPRFSEVHVCAKGPPA